MLDAYQRKRDFCILCTEVLFAIYHYNLIEVSSD